MNIPYLKTFTLESRSFTWKDEKVMRCTVGTLNKTAEKNGIKKTALITVGDFLGDDYSLSKLYDKTFTTEFRKGVTE